MKYRLSPMHVAAAVCAFIVVKYFYNAATQTDYDRHGWGAIFTLFPAIIMGGVFLFTDLIMQLIFSKKKHIVLAVYEIPVLFVILFLYGRYVLYAI
jgi:hypothetical protein